MKRNLIALAVVPLLSSCLTLSGTYRLRAIDEQGQELSSKIDMMAQGSGIYTSRNALCRLYPEAIVLIEDASTGQPLKGESGKRCRR